MSKIKWTPELTRKFIKLVKDPAVEAKDIQKEFGISDHSADHKSRRLGIEEYYKAKRMAAYKANRKAACGEIPDTTQTKVSEPQLIKENAQLRIELTRHKQLGKLLYECVENNIHKLDIPVVRPPKLHKAKKEQELHALRSDAHVGEKVDEGWVQGLAKYDYETYCKRLRTWTDTVIQFYHEDKHLGINRLVINELGDQVTGELIYPGQANAIDRGVVDQVLGSAKEEAEAILKLAAEIPLIDIYAVPGNHGMIGGRHSALHPRSNMDYMFYRLLQMMLAKQENVRFFIAESPMLVAKHGKFTFCLQHGHNAGASAFGIPYYGLDRVARRLPRLLNMSVDILLAGHIHTPASIDANYILTNGSMMGGSDLSINKMQLCSPPSQKIFLLDKDHGVHRETNIHLEDRVVLQPDKNDIFTKYFQQEEKHTVKHPLAIMGRAAGFKHRKR